MIDPKILPQMVGGAESTLEQMEGERSAGWIALTGILTAETARSVNGQPSPMDSGGIAKPAWDYWPVNLKPTSCGPL